MKFSKKLGLAIIFVVLALVSVSSVAALEITYPRGLRSFFSLKVLVNIVILASAMYLLMPLILGKERSPQSKGGHTAMLIMIILLSVVIATSMGDKFIWQQETIKDILDYFIGGEGILRADKIGIFIGGTAVLYWFLDFMNVGGVKEGKGNTMNLALAFIMGSNLASIGTSICTIIRLGQIIGFIIFATSINKGVVANLRKDRAFTISTILSLLMVVWVGHVLKPECNAEFGLFFIRNWWVFVALGVAFAAIGGFGMAKEDAFKKEKLGFISEGLIRTANWFRNKIRNRQVPLLWRMLKKKEIHDRELEGQIPKSWEDLTVLLHIFFNWILRLEVFTVKHRVVVRAEEDTNKIEREVMTDTKDIGNIRSDTKMYKEGSEIVNDKNGGFKLGAHYATYTRTTGRWSGKKIPQSYGALNMEWFVMKFLTLFKNELEAGSGGKPRLKIRKEITADETRKLQASVIEENIEPLKREFIADRDKRFWGAHKRYSHWHRIRSLSNVILDQYRMYGHAYFHTYRFANVKAEVHAYSYDIVEREKGNPLSRDIVLKGKVGTHSKEAGVLKKRPENQYGIPLLHEIDHKGVFVEDLNAIRVEGKRLAYVRKITPTKANIANHEDSHEIMDWQLKEWDAFLDDLRFGTYHPHSLTFEHYKQCMDDKDFAFKKVEKRRVSAMVGPENPAFDLEALKNPIIIYWGRKKYYEENNYTINTSEPVNPFPAISTFGMTKFIAAYIQRKTNPVTAKQFLNYLVGDSGLKIDQVFALLSELPTENKK